LEEKACSSFFTYFFPKCGLAGWLVGWLLCGMYVILAVEHFFVVEEGRREGFEIEVMNLYYQPPSRAIA